MGAWITWQKCRTVIAFGYIIGESTAPLKNKRTFMGVEVHQRIPIEVVAIALIDAGVANHTLLVVDSFQEMNGADARLIANGKAALRSQLELLTLAYSIEPAIAETSSFMNTPAYKALYKDAGNEVRSKNLEGQLGKTLPEGEYSLDFALHEAAVCRYMELEYGMEVKIGQAREKLYDSVIGEITGLDFAYLFPFYAFGNGEEVKTPYNPESGARNGGKRIMLGDEPDKVAEIIKRGPYKAQEAMTRLGFAAALIKGEITLSEKFPQPENCLNSIEALIEQIEMARTRRRFAKLRAYGNI